MTLLILMFSCFNNPMKQSFWQKTTKPIMALAPMAGYTDSAFRQICREMGADVVYSEMISVDAICFDNEKTLKMLEFKRKELPVVFQLFGSKPERFAEATRIVNEKFKGKKSVGLDINFGCPAHKVVKNQSGAALMNELDCAYEIIKTVCDNTDSPVSIKIRTKAKNVGAEEFVNHVKDLPWEAIMIHGRTLAQGFVGEIDFELIKKIKQLVPDKIILANGGITPKDVKKTLELTRADGVGIARGAWGNPWIFNNTSPTWPQRRKTILRHAKLFLKYSDSLIPLRKHLIHYVRGQKNASELRQKIITTETLNDLKSALK